MCKENNQIEEAIKNMEILVNDTLPKLRKTINLLSINCNGLTETISKSCSMIEDHASEIKARNNSIQSYINRIYELTERIK